MIKARRLGKFLFIPALMLLSAGLVAGLISGWSPLYIGLIVAGGIILVLWLGLLSSKVGFWRRRSTQAGTNALVATGAVIIILGLVNFLAVRYSMRIDLTENQILSLSPQSQQIVQNLQQPLKLWIFAPNSNPINRGLLQNYRRYGSEFDFEYVDPQVNLELAQKFNVQTLGEVYLEYGDKTQLVQILSPGERLSEVKLTNAIAKIKSDRTSPVYFLQGHGEPQLQALERGLSQAVTSLEAKGYQIEPLNLAQSPKFPEDAAVIIVAGPQRELFEGEVTALQDYLEGGGSLLAMLDPETDSGLDPLLEDWGVEASELLIIDASETGSIVGYGPATTIVTRYGNHPVTEQFANGISVYPIARPISTVEKEDVEAVALLITDQQSWAESSLDATEVAFDPDQDIEGPLDLGVALSRTAETEDAEESQTSPPESRLIVIGNSTFATNGWFEQQLNGDVFLNSVDWLARDEESTLSIRPREPENRRINLTPLQAGIIGWLAMLIVPLLGIVAAVIAWWRRR